MLSTVLFCTQFVIKSSLRYVEDETEELLDSLFSKSFKISIFFDKFSRCNVNSFVCNWTAPAGSTFLYRDWSVHGESIKVWTNHKSAFIMDLTRLSPKVTIKDMSASINNGTLLAHTSRILTVGLVWWFDRRLNSGVRTLMLRDLPDLTPRASFLYLFIFFSTGDRVPHLGPINADRYRLLVARSLTLTHGRTNTRAHLFSR